MAAGAFPSRLPLLMALLALTGLASHAQEPRFRGGTNAVRLDVYVSKDGAAISDLTVADFEVLEDNVPQTVTSFEIVRARAAAPDAARVEPSSVAEMQERAGRGQSRVFVLFLDTPHVQLSGAYRAANPVAALLDRVIGADDLVGVMTPDMSARNMTLSPRTASVGEMLRTSWAWGERGRLTTTDPREADLQQCYPDVGPSLGLAESVIAKRREQKTLRALGDLLQHLEGVRDERTFVLLLTEGWLLAPADEQLARPLPGVAPRGTEGPGAPAAPRGAADAAPTPSGATSMAWCERERSLVALADLGMEFRQLTQRANRANVSFYPVDARGLVVFDNDLGTGRRVLSPTADAAGLTRRRDGLRTLAADTDGTVVVDTALEQALPRLLTDVGSYYLLGYVSTNPKTDGKYRRLTVRVRRPDVTVRARPGYLAPTAAELNPRSSSTSERSSSVSTPVSEALSRLPVSRKAPPLYLATAGGRGVVRVVVELDRTTAAAPEWSRGGAFLIDLEPADGTGGPRRTSRVDLPAGARVEEATLPDGELLRPGRYQVKVQATPEGGRAINLASTVEIPGPTALLGTAVISSRRGPGTGKHYEPTADARFRRTERVSLEVAKLAEDVVVTGQLLNPGGQVLQVPVTVSERPETTGPPTIVAEVMLAPLAAGEYVVELTAKAGSKTELRTFAIRMVPG